MQQGRQPEQIPDTAGEQALGVELGVLHAIGIKPQGSTRTAHFVMHSLQLGFPD